MRLSAACLLAFALTAPVLAQEAAPVAPAAPVKEKKVCRSETPTGSIMAVHTCHTKTEWAQIDAANRANTDKFSDLRTANRGNGLGLGK